MKYLVINLTKDLTDNILETIKLLRNFKNPNKWIDIPYSLGQKIQYG